MLLLYYVQQPIPGGTMKTYLAYILDSTGYHDETTWAESEESAREEVAKWYPTAPIIHLSLKLVPLVGLEPTLQRF